MKKILTTMSLLIGLYATQSYAAANYDCNLAIIKGDEAAINTQIKIKPATGADDYTAEIPQLAKKVSIYLSPFKDSMFKGSYNVKAFIYNMTPQDPSNPMGGADVLLASVSKRSKMFFVTSVTSGQMHVLQCTKL